MAASDVIVKILSDTKGFDEGLETSTSKVDKASERMGDAGKKMTTRMTLPILGVGAAMAGLATKAGENADRLFDMSAQTGISTDKLQEYEFVAGQAGVATDFFKNATEAVIKDLDKTAKGVGPASEAYKKLGVSVLDANGNLKDAGTITEEAMKALAAIEDPTQRAALAQDIFKGANQDMLAVLSQGTEEIEAQRKAAHELGAVQSGESLQSANKFRMGMEQLQAQVGGVVGMIGAEFAPLLSDVVMPLVQDHIVPAIRTFAEFIGDLAERFNNLNPRMKGLIGGLIGVAAVAGPLLMVGAKMIKMFAMIGKAFQVLSAIMAMNPWILLIAAIVALVVLVVMNWDTIVEYLKKVWEWITEKVGGVATFFKEAFKTALEFVKNLFLNFTGPGLLIKHFDDIKAAVTRVKDWVMEKFDAVVTFLGKLPGRVATAVGDLFSAIPRKFKEAMNVIIDAWNRLDIGIGPFSIPSWVPVVGGNRWEIKDMFPDLKRFHSGGTFRAPHAGGEGLAILRDQERVYTPGGGPNMGAGGMVFAPQVGTLVGSDGMDELFEMFRSWALGVQRRNGSTGLA